MFNKTATVRDNLVFFKQKITTVNTQRLHLNRNKGLAKYLAQNYPQNRSLAYLDKGMGVLSFSVYFARIGVNLGLMYDLLNDPNEKQNKAMLENVYYELANDALWFSVNLTQFLLNVVPLSHQVGFLGLHIENLGNAVDLLVLTLRFIEYYNNYESMRQEANTQERMRMEIEWEHRLFNFIRTLLTLSMVITVFALYAFSVAAVPIAPVLSFVVVLSSIIKMILDAQKNELLLAHLPELTAQEKMVARQKHTLGYWDELNQMALNQVFVPLGLFLFITAPLLPTFLACLAMILVYATSYFLHQDQQAQLQEVESLALKNNVI